MTDILTEDVGGTWDWTIRDGDIVMTGDEGRTQEVGQRVVYRLMTWIGESVYDRNVGVPYIEGVFGFEPIAGVVGILTQVAIDTPGVDGVEGQPSYILSDVGVLALTMRLIVGDAIEEITLEVSPT